MLICRLAEPIGRACIIPTYLEKSITAVDCTIYRVDPKKVHREYMLHCLNSEAQLKKANDIAGGSTRQRISRGNLGNLKIILPLLTEQKKIAEILDTIAETIAKTEECIAKLKKIKAGLVHDLLTRGIDENGELRDPVRHPEQFKQSAIGLIPKEWSLVCLKEVCKTSIRDFGSFSMTNLIHFLDAGIPFLKSEMIEEENLKQEEMFYISEKVHSLLKKSWVYPNNILYSKIGSALGKATLYDGSLGICNSNAAIAKIDVDESLSIPIFIVYILNSPRAKERIKRSIISLLPRVNLTDLYAFQLPLPNLKEQQRIVDTLNSNNQKINQEEVYLEKLKLQKKGLMHDLLTGKIRVKPRPS